MARLILTAVVLAFLFIQLASCQDAACLSALSALSAQTQCISGDDVSVVCQEPCRGYYDDVFAACPASVSLYVAISLFYYIHASIHVHVGYRYTETGI